MNTHATAHVALLTVELLIPASASLKTKRRVLKSIKDRVRARFNASIAEIDYLDQWQRSVLGVSMVGNDRVHLEKGANAITLLLRDNLEIEMLDIHLEWL